MAHPEMLEYIQNPFLEQRNLLKMAKPAIPIERPQRREIPEIPDPMPQRLVPPAPSKPVETPRLPVPAR